MGFRNRLILFFCWWMMLKKCMGFIMVFFLVLIIVKLIWWLGRMFFFFIFLIFRLMVGMILVRENIFFWGKVGVMVIIFREVCIFVVMNMFVVISIYSMGGIVWVFNINLLYLLCFWFKVYLIVGGVLLIFFFYNMWISIDKFLNKVWNVIFFIICK